MGRGSGITVLIVDDEPGIYRALSRVLTRDGYTLQSVFRLSEAMTAIAAQRFDILLVDKNLPDGSGLDLATDVRDNRIDSQVVLITGYPSIESTVQAIREGVADYLRKPINADDLKLCLRRVMEVRRVKMEYWRSLEESSDS